MKLYENESRDFYITSKGDGNHRADSCHYEESAIDFKRQGLAKSTIKQVCGDDFDVVEYTDKRDIFHVEFDPKRK